MVSFSCEGCGDVLTKKKLDPHRNQCRGATFTCLDCMVHFWGTEYRAHTSCISEAQKYQGALYRPDKEKKGPKNANNGPKKAYIEDAPDTQLAVVDAPPEAPTPPSAAPDFQAQTPVNVFDFYVGSATPNPSTLDLAAPPSPSAADSSAVVRFSQLEDSSEALVQYGTGPVPSASPAPKTPAAKERKTKAKKDTPSSAAKSDKKRKRLHVDTSASPSVDRDLEMTDAPPVLHSGLTGGLQKLMAGAFPPSPDYSGDNVEGGAAAEAAAAAAGEPASPVKRAKRAKEGKKAEGGFSTALMQMMTSTKRPAKKSSGAAKEKKKKTDKSARPKKQRAAGQKLLEYKTPAAAAAAAAGQLVVYAAGEGAGPEELAGMLLGLVSKGPESERGVSMNKALKRYHRLRAAGGAAEARGADEKELWKSLRMRRNERGEIVLFF